MTLSTSSGGGGGGSVAVSVAPSADLGSFGSQSSVHFEELEFQRPCGEGSFGKVRQLGSDWCWPGLAWPGLGWWKMTAGRQAARQAARQAGTQTASRLPAWPGVCICPVQSQACAVLCCVVPSLQVYIATWHQTYVAVKVLHARSEGLGAQVVDQPITVDTELLGRLREVRGTATPVHTRAAALQCAHTPAFSYTRLWTCLRSQLACALTTCLLVDGSYYCRPPLFLRNAPN